MTAHPLNRWLARSLFVVSFSSLAVGILAVMPANAEGGGAIVGEVVTKSPKQRVNIVVHLDKVAGSFRPPAHPAQMDQKGMAFIPHVMPILKGTTVKFQNSDSVRHNVFTPDGDKYNLGTWAQNESKTHTFAATGIFHQLCNVHPEMGAVILVYDNPYFAVSGADGKFRIEGVPPGTYTMKTWSEKLPEVSKEVTVAADGSATVKIDMGR